MHHTVGIVILAVWAIVAVVGFILIDKFRR